MKTDDAYLIHDVVEKGAQNVLMCILNHGGNIMAITKSKGLTVFHIAARKGDITTFELLLKKCERGLNQPDKYGWTPLHYASFHNRKEMVIWLLQQKNIKLTSCPRCKAADHDDFLSLTCQDYSDVKNEIRKYRKSLFSLKKQVK